MKIMVMPFFPPKFVTIEYRVAHTRYVEVTERLINELNRKIVSLTEKGNS